MELKFVENAIKSTKNAVMELRFPESIIDAYEGDIHSMQIYFIENPDLYSIAQFKVIRSFEANLRINNQTKSHDIVAIALVLLESEEIKFYGYSLYGVYLGEYDDTKESLHKEEISYQGNTYKKIYDCGRFIKGTERSIL